MPHRHGIIKIKRITQVQQLWFRAFTLHPQRNTQPQSFCILLRQYTNFAFTFDYTRDLIAKSMEYVFVYSTIHFIVLTCTSGNNSPARLYPSKFVMFTRCQLSQLFIRKFQQVINISANIPCEQTLNRESCDLL